MANQKARFLAFVALVYHLEAKKYRFIDESDCLTILTGHYDAYFSKFAHFLLTTMTEGQTKYFTPCTCARSKNI